MAYEHFVNRLSHCWVGIGVVGFSSSWREWVELVEWWQWRWEGEEGTEVGEGRGVGRGEGARGR